MTKVIINGQMVRAVPGSLVIEIRFSIVLEDHYSIKDWYNNAGGNVISFAGGDNLRALHSCSLVDSSTIFSTGKENINSVKFISSMEFES